MTRTFGKQSALEALDERAKASNLHLCLDYTAARKGTLWVRQPHGARKCVSSVPIPDGDIEAAAERLGERWA